jgi:hypothetical protein
MKGHERYSPERGFTDSPEESEDIRLGKKEGAGISKHADIMLYSFYQDAYVTCKKPTLVSFSNFNPPPCSIRRNTKGST